MSKPVIKSLPIASIRRDSGAQFRDKISETHIGRIQEGIRENAKIPPIEVFFDGSEYWLADGEHRIIAHENEHKINIRCSIQEGSQLDARRRGRRANSEHLGLPRSNKAKKAAVLDAIADPDWMGDSNPVIAQKCAVSPEFVRQLRAEQNAGASPTVGDAPATRTTSDGRQYPVNIGSGKPKEGKSAATSDTSTASENSSSNATNLADNPSPSGTSSSTDSSTPSVTTIPQQEQTVGGSTPSNTQDFDTPNELTTEQKIRQSPLGLALAMYGHQGFKFVESAMMQEDFWKKISAIHAIAGRLRHATNATASVLAPVARFAHWSEWEGCPACKGEGRFGERKDPCDTCKTWGFVIIPQTGVSADDVRKHAESLQP